MSDSTSVKDRRKYRRVDTRIDLQGTPAEGGVVARLTARNLSLGGLYCTSSTHIPEMTRLAVSLALPDGREPATPTAPMDLEAVVVRCEALPPGSANGHRYECALFFTKIDDSDRTRLATFLDR